jgi:hemoglobin
MSSSSPASLYTRIGGYDAIAAVADNLVGRLQSDALLGRFWAHRGTDGILREKQLLIDFLCSSAGGPVLYTGRNMRTSHAGMRISQDDWAVFMNHVRDTLEHFHVPEAETSEVVAFVESTRDEIVEP